jgi:hypothetical protein
MSDDLEKAGDLAADIGIYGEEAAYGAATYGASIILEKAIQDNYGFSVHDELTNETKALGYAGGDAAYNATSDATHESVLDHYENAGEAWDKGNYGEAVSEGAAVVTDIIGGILPD